MRKAGLATLLCVTLLAPARAEDAADFFRGKTVRIIVGVGVGSGYDLNARLLARFLPNYIPGHPAVIVQNQPGAGSLTMTNQLFIAGPFDGTAIGASFNGMPTTPTALRRAFDAALKDPALIAEADKSKIEIDPLSGEEVIELVKQVSATPPDVIARVHAALEKK